MSVFRRELFGSSLVLYCACAILTPYARPQALTNTQVNVSDDGVSAGAGVNRRASVNANSNAYDMPLRLPPLNEGNSSRVGNQSNSRPLSTFTGDVPAFGGVDTSSGIAFTREKSANATPAKGAEVISSHALSSQGTGSYPGAGVFPDSTRGTGWPSPPLSFSPYRFALPAYPLVWMPSFNATAHLKLSYDIGLGAPAPSHSESSLHRRLRRNILNGNLLQGSSLSRSLERNGAISLTPLSNQAGFGVSSDQLK